MDIVIPKKFQLVIIWRQLRDHGINGVHITRLVPMS